MVAKRGFTLLEQADSWKRDLANGLEEIGLPSDALLLDLFFRYARLLQKWGSRVNLTSRLDPHEIISIHFLDSLSFLAARTPDLDSTLVDIGSGGGFPGLPVKLLRSDLRITLLEPSEKKAAFLKAVVHELGLEKVRIVRARAGKPETFPGPPGQFDQALSRAVSPIPSLLSMADDLVRPGGLLVAYKGPDESVPDLISLSLSEKWTFSGRNLVEVPGRSTSRALFFFERR